LSREEGGVEIGEPGFDSAVGRGLLRGSLIVVAGNPGLGKTILSAQFLAGGAAKGEKGIYASFAEGREVLISYLRSVGHHLDRLEAQGKVRILDFVTMKEAGVSSLLEMIVSEVSRFKAKRLVIDSFSALAQSFGKPIDARIVLQTVLGKIVRQLGCTTFLILEMPVGEERIGWGVEEFVADGIIQLRRGEVDGRLFRSFCLLKMRGMEIANPTHIFTLSGGFRVFRQNSMIVPEKIQPWKPIPEAEGCISTGNKDLDDILAGRIRPGCVLTLEVATDVPFAAFSSVAASLQANFCAHGRGMFVIPSMQATSEVVESIIMPLVGEEQFYKRCRAGEFREPRLGGLKPYQVLLRGRSILEDYDELISQVEGLREGTGREVLIFAGIDTFEYTYGVGETVRILGRAVSSIRSYKDLAFFLVRSGMGIVPQIQAISDVYIKLINLEGVVMLYGAKPRTQLFELGADETRGYPGYRLTPVV